MADVDETEPSGENEPEETSFAEIARLADDLVSALIRKIDPDHRSTGRFVILADALDVRSGTRLPEPYFLVPPDQVGWETQGLLQWARTFEDQYASGVYEYYDDPDLPE